MLCNSVSIFCPRVTIRCEPSPLCCSGKTQLIARTRGGALMIPWNAICPTWAILTDLAEDKKT